MVKYMHIRCNNIGKACVILVCWLQLPSKEDEPRERNLRAGGVYGKVLYG
jgi:hypothetical protein